MNTPVINATALASQHLPPFPTATCSLPSTARPPTPHVAPRPAHCTRAPKHTPLPATARLSLPVTAAAISLSSARRRPPRAPARAPTPLLSEHARARATAHGTHRPGKALHGRREAARPCAKSHGFRPRCLDR